MASETKYPAFVLFIASCLLVAGGWLMGGFPIFIFLGFAPLFALTDRVDSTSSVWEKMEWVLLAQSLSFLASHAFDLSYLVSSLIFGILFTLPFIGYVWVRQTLGPRAGKIIIILFWLSLEYLLLKFIPSRGVFLGDALQLQGDWMNWNMHTGYLGSSLWILLTNLAVYQAALSKEAFRWHWIVLAVLLIGGPIVYSYTLHSEALSRATMINLYSENSEGINLQYLAQGEFVVRTAAWISSLILLFTLVKSQTSKK